MKDKLVKIDYREEYTRSYDIRYIGEITHTGLNEFKLFSANEQYILNNKINAYVAKLEEKWNKIVEKQNLSKSQEVSQKEAEKRTLSAIKALEEVDNLLIHTLGIDVRVDWESLKDKTNFKELNPNIGLLGRLESISRPHQEILLGSVKKNSYPIRPIDPIIPNLDSYKPKLSYFDKILKTKNGDKKIEEADTQFQIALVNWRKQCQEIDKIFALQCYEIDCDFEKKS